ncbi:probable LRR receptor-like serine/threonine-protein kinase RFK1 [Papaver somniferum]|uniref:probable LRR receptor-like serine/threonine-protein kinase RFK1 n=1 Tax=Papaver somniferum TaxID=3469 RepID=UPI000E70468D|nr:probable LRR receptor-like serine/threonine-protein kinase RFK1 [Papaver somniferum]
MANASVFSIGNGQYLFQFTSVEDKNKVLESSGLLHMEGKPLIFLKWNWKLKIDKAETTKTVPIWVKIYNLPLFLWNPSFLSKVVSAFGIPICADQKTKKQQRLDYAWVYMRVDASKPLLDSFLISVKGIDYLLNLEYDWLLWYFLLTCFNKLILENLEEEIQNGNFSYQQIKAATKDFRPAYKIGEGGFGSVYMGVLTDGRAIAVKVISPKLLQGKKEFLNEINAMSTYKHPNIVPLLGHCVAEDNRFVLVYDYYANGDLDHALFGNKNLKKRLDWETRVKICIGIAKSLVYLHEGAQFKIVHRDIKLANVLLDVHFTPKMADFGLAKLLTTERVLTLE